jgi:flagellar protein FlaF
MSLRAYHQAAVRSENPREMEYRLFAQVTLALMEAAKADPHDIAARIDALDWNRRVWSTLGEDCASPGNALPAQLRASIISLSIWVGRQTSKVVRREDTVESLIEINRMIMQGLAPSSAPARGVAA